MKAKGIFFLFFFFFLTVIYGQNISVWQGTSSMWTQGTGTQSDPYRIESAEQLAYLATSTNGGTNYSGVFFKLMIDIDLNSISWVPIGNSSTRIFQGNFDGNYHTIHKLNVVVSGGSNTYAGLFGNIASANISKINLKGGAINVATSSLNYTGAICGYVSNSNIRTTDLTKM